jgi:hypothetical protein
MILRIVEVLDFESSKSANRCEIAHSVAIVLERYDPTSEHFDALL